MKTVVTGGNGFIGSHLVKALLNQGREVVIVSDFSQHAAENLTELGVELSDIKIVRTDLSVYSQALKALKDAEIVFHLAAIPSVERSVRNPGASHEVNATGTLSVLLAARDTGVKRVVFASSSSVYGDTPTLPKEEGMPPMPKSPYAAQKMIGEQYCRVYSFVRNETSSIKCYICCNN